MTEQEWSVCDNTSEMYKCLLQSLLRDPPREPFFVQYLSGLSERKCRLVSLAAATRLRSHFPTGAKDKFDIDCETVERCIDEDGLVPTKDDYWITDPSEIEVLRGAAQVTAGFQISPENIRCILPNPFRINKELDTHYYCTECKKINGRTKAEYFICYECNGIIQEGTHPVLSWHDGKMPKFALEIYKSKKYELLPVLADLLEESGYDNPEALIHCRGENIHVHGCWVLDLLLGKE